MSDEVVSLADRRARQTKIQQEQDLHAQTVAMVQQDGFTRWTISYLETGEIEIEYVGLGGTDNYRMDQAQARRMGKKLLIAVEKARRWQTKSKKS